jgi:hypothetical protein
MNAKEAHEELDVDLECPIPPRSYEPAVYEKQEEVQEEMEYQLSA